MRGRQQQGKNGFKDGCIRDQNRGSRKQGKKVSSAGRQEGAGDSGGGGQEGGGQIGGRQMG